MAGLAEMTSQGWNNGLHFDSVQDSVAAAGSFQQLKPGQPFYIQQNNHYAYSKTEAESLNDGLNLGSVLAAVPQ